MLRGRSSKPYGFGYGFSLFRPISKEASLKTDQQTRSRTGTALSAWKQMLRGFHCSVPQLF